MGGFRLLVLLAAMVAVALGIGAALRPHSDKNTGGGLLENATVAAESTAMANVRSAEISLEAWRADHGTAGPYPDRLRVRRPARQSSCR